MIGSEGKFVRKAIMVLAGLGVMLAVPTGAGAATKADTVLKNGTVLTMSKKHPQAQAVAIRKGRLVYVGSNRGVRSYTGKRTRVINLKGKTAMPGLIDGHSHPLGGGDVLDDCDLGNIEATIQDLLDVMLQCDAADPASSNSDWLQVSNWSPVGVLPAGTVVTRQDLDVAFPNRPVYVQGSDFHNSWVNSRALELAGVTKDTPDPVNGEFVRDSEGNPTGLLKDGAQGLVQAAIPPKSFSEQVADGLRAVKAINAVGITSTTDAAADPSTLAVWKALAKRGEMTLRMNSYMALSNSDSVGDDVAYYRAMVKKFATQRLRIPGIKMFMDGVIEYPAQTAALLDPYLEQKGDSWVPGTNRGDLYYSQHEANKVVAKFDQLGKRIHIHTIGDAAARVALNAAAYARKKNHSARKRNIVLAHLQLVDPSDYDRFGKLGVFADMQLQWASSNFWTEESLRPFIGEERYHRMYPARSLIKAGAPLAMGSDWPVDPLNPWDEIMTAHTRKNSFGGLLLPNQSIPIATALRAHTMGSAEQLGIAGKVGSLVPGKDADIVVIDRNPLKVSPMKIENTKVLRTMVRGRTVYRPGPGSAALVAKAASISTGEAGHSHGL